MGKEPVPSSATSASARERTAFRSLERACYAGFDSTTLRATLVERVRSVVPSEVAAVGTLDPDTALMTRAGSALEPAGYLARFLDRAYLRGEAECMTDQARSGRVVFTTPSDLMYDFLRAEGLGREMRVIFSCGGDSWGVYCATRESRSRPFGDREAQFLRRLAPHAAHALKMATLVDMAASADVAERDGVSASASTPGVVVIDRVGRILHRTTPAARQLADLTDIATAAPPLPAAVVSVLTRLRVLARRPDAIESSLARSESTLRARGRSGQWYTLTAALSEPDATGESASIVVIAPITRPDVAPLLARLYGLSRREREVLTLVARGESTKGIAARLGISPYTVQDHLDHAFDKVGVRGRRALLAKLFLDGTSALSAAERHAVHGARTEAS